MVVSQRYLTIPWKQVSKWPDAGMLEHGAMGGAFFETWVVSELIKNLYAHNRRSLDYLYYYRDTDQKEIDLLYVEQDRIYPIEIKTASSAKNPTRHFSVLKKYGQPRYKMKFPVDSRHIIGI